MRVLDVGCGPGSITVGLAGVVAPAPLVGIDVAAQVGRARDLAGEHGVMNALFGVANLYCLPFPNASFDAVFAHTVVMGLLEPVRALTELRRVLRPGGIIGLRDADVGTEVIFPTSPLLEQRRALLLRVRSITATRSPVVSSEVICWRPGSPKRKRRRPSGVPGRSRRPPFEPSGSRPNLLGWRGLGWPKAGLIRTP